MRPANRPEYSYLEDPSVPAFDQDRILLVMDGECALCSHAARRIARMDRADQVRIATAQSGLGRALLQHYGFRPDDPDSWLMIRSGQAYGSLDAILRLAAVLNPWLGVFGVLRIMPAFVQDWLYARVARNRYAMFGRSDICALPDGELRRRLTG